MKMLPVALAAVMLSRPALGGGRDPDPVGCVNMGTRPVCEQVSTCKWSSGGCVDAYTCHQAKSKPACEAHQQHPKACEWYDQDCWRPDRHGADKCTFSSGIESCKKIHGCSFVNGRCVTYDPCSPLAETDCDASLACRWYGGSRCSAKRVLCPHPHLQKEEGNCKRYGRDDCEWKDNKCLVLDAADACTLVKGEPLCRAVFGCNWHGPAGGCKTSDKPVPAAAAPGSNPKPAVATPPASPGSPAAPAAPAPSSSSQRRDPDPVGCVNMGTRPVCEQVSTCKWSSGGCVDAYTCDDAAVGSKPACEAHQQHPKACEWYDQACWRPDRHGADKCTFSSGIESCKKIRGCAFVNGRCAAYDPCSPLPEGKCRAALACRWRFSGRCELKGVRCAGRPESRCRQFREYCEWKDDKCLVLDAADACTLVQGESMCRVVSGCNWHGAAGGCKDSDKPVPAAAAPATPGASPVPQCQEHAGWKLCKGNENCCPAGTKCQAYTQHVSLCWRNCPQGWACDRNKAAPCQEHAGWKLCKGNEGCCPAGTKCQAYTQHVSLCWSSCPQGWACNAQGSR